jgi:hypothetical protein
MRLTRGRIVSGVHQLRGLGPQDPRLAELAVVQVGDHEARHVRRRRADAARRRRADQLEFVRGMGGVLVALRHARLPVGRQGLAERRARHAERREDVLLDVVGERHARYALHDVAGERARIV